MVVRWIGLALLLLLACSRQQASPSSANTDGGHAGSAAEPAPVAGAAAEPATRDAATRDAATRDASTPDARVPPDRDAATAGDGGTRPGMDAAADAGADRDATQDAGSDAALDASGPSTTAAVPGARCKLSERIGLIEVSLQGATPYVSGRVHDRTHPWYGEPALTTATCSFYRYTQTRLCPQCASGQLCVGGKCVDAPRALRDTTLTLRAGARSQTFIASDLGELYGQVTLAGDALAATLTFGEHTVTALEMALPGAFTNLGGTLAGGYDQPEALDVQWTAPTSGSVYTLIPINHHAAGPTFTECTVPASARALHVGGDMLRPLAVETGLEFQGLDHAHFAAAETPAGCVELRFTARAFVNF